MSILRLRRLPTISDVAQLGSIGLDQFIEQFNACALDANTARIDVLHEGQTVVLGDIAWEHTSNTWYLLEPNTTSVRVSHRVSPQDNTQLEASRTLLSVVRNDHPNHVEFTIESAPSTAVLKLQCFVASHHAERLAERIRELTHAGYFDRHPKAIDKLAQCCDVLLVDTQLVKCRQTLPRLMYQHYETRTGSTADLDEILNAVDTDKAMTP